MISSEDRADRLDAMARALERQADEAEALSHGSWMAGGRPSRSHYQDLDAVEETRARARGYRQEARLMRRSPAQ